MENLGMGTSPTDVGAERVPAGRCRSCLYARVVPAKANDAYYFCERSVDDPRYARYPHLPMLTCDGHAYRAEAVSPREP